MPHLAQIVESIHHAHQQDDTTEANGDTHNPNDDNPEQPRLQPKRSVSASVPNSPRSQPNSTLRSPSLSVPHSPKQRTSRGYTEAIDPHAAQFVRTESGFRSAWSYRDPEEERKGSRRSRRGSWTGTSRSPTVEEGGGLWRRWVEIPLGLAPSESGEQPQEDGRVESPQTEHGELGPRTASPEPHEQEGPQNAPAESSSAAQQHQDSGAGSPSRQGSISLWPLPDPLKLFGLTRTQSMPHIGSRKNSRQDTQDSHAENGEAAHVAATQRWNVLKQRLRASSTAGGGFSPLKRKRRSLVVQPSMAAQVDLNEELLAGPLALQILRMWFERDENGRRRVPVLLQHIKIRVSDSCEYGDGAARWVIYRELKDFLSLHAHYSFSYTAYRASAGGNELKIPEFPRAGIPLFNILKKEAREKGNPAGRAEFARQQREALENYLIGLIKAVMFRPEANRLCRWFEISALSVALASRGGIQGKAGLLRVISSNSSRKGPHPINFSSWKRNHTSTWWLVRESYLVSVADPAELTIDDVFMLDADFSIERPKRVYRQGLNMLHIGGGGKDAGGDNEESRRDDWDLSKRREKGKEKEKDHDGGATEKGETETIKSRSTISKLFSRSSMSKGKSNKDAQPPKEEAEDKAKATMDSLKEKSKAKAEHLTVPDQGGREVNTSASSGEPSGDRPQTPEQQTLGIYGNASQADVKAVSPTSPDSKGQYRTANPQGSNTAGIPDPHHHGSRWKRFGRRSSSAAESVSSSSSSNSNDTNHQTVIDPSIGKDPRQVGPKEEEEVAGAGNKKKKQSLDVSQHTFYIKNGQRKLKLVAKNERQMLQFIASMERMAAQSHWTGENRFGSFAPIRLNVNAQWLADGRDYFWNLSRAIMLAKERIYIHDWWLSPELYLRRPGQEHYRLDRLLQRKAEQGVKIYVILYKEVSNRTTPTDSNYAKRKLMALHPNIMVQRSPAHFSTGTFYWAHHEKMCVIDEAIAFMGGLDLCFGRWDTPQHVMVDDGNLEGPEGSNQIWPGKDYSNARVMDFHTLNKPHEDMYDRSKVARMPWHDVGLQFVGQPARDLCRHFVQRWNYLLRTKTHSRVMPFLLPAPDFKITELNDQGLTGTCEVQICRSAGPWSLGTATRIEHSIQNAYLKAIELSEHFVYIENQFFITSTVMNDIPVENNIGDALVHRIIRAHREKTPWRACIVIPLLPGFTFPIDHNDASSIRLIVELQNRSICRGPHSIFSRLRKEGIEPNDYISFFSLRGWGKLENNTMTTEQVYIHAKIMIVDDRVAIIGSANINERSMRGDRDSELACVVRDTDMIQSRMAGKPFKVGRFAHTLRIRLMREHVGIDTDAMYEADLMATDAKVKPEDVKSWDPDHEQVKGKTEGITTVKHRGAMERYSVLARDVGEQALLGLGEATAKFVGKATKHGLPDNPAPMSKHKDDEKRIFGSDGSQQPGFASSKVPTLEEKVVAEHLPKKREEGEDKPLMDAIDEGQDEPASDAVSEARVQDGGDLFGAPADAAPSAKEDNRPPNSRPGQDESSPAERSAVAARQQLRKHLAVKTGAKPHTLPTPKPEIDPHGFGDPLDPGFWKDAWCSTAVHNTEIYRKVFHCTPDDLVTTWKMYKEYLLFQERLNKPPKDAPPNAPHVGRVPSEGGTAGEEAGGPPNTHPDGEMDPKESVLSDKKEANPVQRSRSPTNDGDSSNHLNPPPSAGSQRRSAEPGMGPDGRPRRPTNFDEPLEQWERDEFESLLGDVKGHLARPLEAAAGFLKTITERPALAAVVHCLGLDLFDWRPYNRPSRSDVRAKRFFEAFRTALPKIVNLQDLEICNWGNSVVDAIGQLPRGCQFPAQQHYSGPMEILGDTRSNALKTLRVSTAGAGTVTIFDAFSAAARLSRQTLRALHLRCQGGDGDNGLWATIYAEISLFFPKLRYLGLESRYTVTHALLDILVPAISKLPDLRLLRLANWKGGRYEEKRHIEYLHANCPQLRAISLSDEPWRFCEGSQIWLSSPKEGYCSDEQLWEAADYRKYLEDPDHEGFGDHSLVWGQYSSL
ncbi:Phospholipase D1 [Tulasnella sp. 425]|nr:Phospholipase D1 [Tulasnella sp. 425]